MENSVIFDKSYLDKGDWQFVSRALYRLVLDCAAFDLKFSDVEVVNIKSERGTDGAKQVSIGLDFGDKFSKPEE